METPFLMISFALEHVNGLYMRFNATLRATFEEHLLGSLMNVTKWLLVVSEKRRETKVGYTLPLSPQDFYRGGVQEQIAIILALFRTCMTPLKVSKYLLTSSFIVHTILEVNVVAFCEGVVQYIPSLVAHLPKIYITIIGRCSWKMNTWSHNNLMGVGVFVS